jgi:hypothetical protein
LHEGYIIPDRNALGDLDESKWEIGPNGKPRDPWQRSETVPMLTMEGEEILFTTGSWGGHCALVALQKAYRIDGSHRNPIIGLGTTRHQNQFGGMNDRPAFNIVGWAKSPPQEAKLIEAKPVDKQTSAEIIDDQIPF